MGCLWRVCHQPRRADREGCGGEEKCRAGCRRGGAQERRRSGEAVLRRCSTQEAEMYDAYDARILLTLGSATAKQ
jgi:hypothetical protein